MWQNSTFISVETYRCVEHGDVVDENVLNDIDLVLVLAQRANGDTMRAIAMKVLNNHVCGIGLERDAV